MVSNKVGEVGVASILKQISIVIFRKILVEEKLNRWASFSLLVKSRRANSDGTIS